MSKQAGELAKLQDFFPPGARDVTASPLGRAPRTVTPSGGGSRVHHGRSSPQIRATEGLVLESRGGSSHSRSQQHAGSAALDNTSIAHLEACKRQLTEIVAAFEARPTSSTATLVRRCSLLTARIHAPCLTLYPNVRLFTRLLNTALDAARLPIHPVAGRRGFPRAFRVGGVRCGL